MTAPSSLSEMNFLEKLFCDHAAVNILLQKMRAKAWDHFQEIGLPNRKDEAYKYLRLHQFYAQQYVAATPSNISSDLLTDYILPECVGSVLVFVNGYYQPSLSNLSNLSNRLIVAPLAEAMKTYGTFLNNQWAKSLKEEIDALAVLNAALHQQGIFIYLPPKYACEAPIQILQVVDTKDQPMLVLPRIHLFAGSQSQADFVTTLAYISGQGYAINQAADLAIEEGARIRYTQIVCNAPPDIWHFDALRTHLKRDSRFESIQVTQGSTTVRHDYRAVLIGENAEASLNGVWMLDSNRESHVHVLMDHQAPHCRSNQLFKGVLNDASRSSFEGKIYVRQAAQKTDAFQLNNNLLLSDRAHADSKPNLEIFADDVKASHGATIGQLDNEQLFYMRTRGFSDEEAKNMLVYSYCKEVIDLIPIPSLQAKITRQAKAYLKMISNSKM